MTRSARSGDLDRPVDTVAGTGRPAGSWRLASAVEVALAAVAVVFDLAIPSLVIFGLMALSLLARRQGLSAIGMHRVSRPLRLVVTMFALAAAWTVLDVGLLKPIENHLTGTRQDMSQFLSLRANLTMLVAWIALAWVVAAFVETVAFIGYVQTRVTDVLGSTGGRLAIAMVLSSLLLGLLHTEYGIVGVTVSTVNGVFYCVLRHRYASLWAPILAHGFIDTIGLCSVFLVGPVYGLW